MWKKTVSLSQWHPHDNPTTSKIVYDDIKEVFLVEKWNSFHLSRNTVDYLHLNDFLEYECELYLKQSLTPPQHKIIVAYHTSNHRLAIETGQWSTIPIPRDTRLFHFCSCNAIESESHTILECPLYNSISDKFPSLLENVGLGNLKCFFHLDPQVSLYLSEATALRHFEESPALKPS